jgi:LPXTG-motif cell wall-anchored protein
MAQKARAARLVTLALATGTLVAMTSTAGAASTTTTATDLVAKAQGASVQITLNIPTQIASALNISPTLVQKISFTDGNVLTSDLSGVAATANLGQGNIPAVSSLLDKTAKATLASPTADASLLAVSKPAGLPVDLGVGTLSSLVSSPVATTKGTLSKSNSELVGLTVGNVVAIPSLANNVISPVTDAITGQLENASGTVAGTVTSVTNTLVDIANTADGQITSTGVAATPTVKAAAETLATTLQSTLDQLGGLTDLINGLAAKNANAVELHTLLSSHEITRNGSSVTSHVENSIASIDVLGGLVTVDGLESAATATAGGTAGSASTDVTKPVLHVKVADAVDFVLDQAGIHLAGDLGKNVPSSLQDTVNGALTTVTGLVNDLAGISVDYGKVSQSADAKGRYAVADVPGVTLTIDPPILHGKLNTPAGAQNLPVKVLEDGKKFLQIALVPAHAEVLAVHSSKTPNTPIKEFSPENPQGPLPHTGGEYGILFAVGAMLLTGAAIVRRRRFSEV